MSTQSNVIPESSVRSQGIAAVVVPALRLLYWSVRRELWEHRAIYVAPVAVTVVFLFGFAISLAQLLVEMHLGPWVDPLQLRQMFHQPYELAEDLIMAAVLLVGMFYSVEALHGERRDRSILFWKSLPVSDTATVLSKAAIPIVVLPLIAFGVAVLTQCIMLLESSVVLLASGLSVTAYWARLQITQGWIMLLFHFLCIHGLWQSPIYGWLLFISGWARRMPILWAVLPPLTIGVVEKVVFNTTHFGTLIGNRFTGGDEGSAIMEQGHAMGPMALTVPAHFLINRGLWIGLAFTAAFLVAAVRVRRCRGPI